MTRQHGSPPFLTPSLPTVSSVPLEETSLCLGQATWTPIQTCQFLPQSSHTSQHLLTRSWLPLLHKSTRACLCQCVLTILLCSNLLRVPSHIKNSGEPTVSTPLRPYSLSPPAAHVTTPAPCVLSLPTCLVSGIFAFASLPRIRMPILVLWHLLSAQTDLLSNSIIIARPFLAALYKLSLKMIDKLIDDRYVDG